MFKQLLLASALSLSAITAAQAAVEQTEVQTLSTTQATHQLQLADRNGGSSNSGSGSSNSGHNESNSGSHDNDDNDSADDNGDDNDNDESGSGRRKPRVPGGSGCDDPGDVAEHAGCRT